MKNTVNAISIIQRIEEMFSDSIEPANFNNYTNTEYLDLLKLVRTHLTARMITNNYVRKFLYYGCLKFDRFTPPSPYVVDPKQHINFESFLDTLVAAENYHPRNTATLRMRALRDRIYREFDCMAVEAISSDILSNYVKNIDEIAPPVAPEKLIEFLEEKKLCQAIIGGLADKSIRTKITTRVPFILHLSPLLLKFIWQSMPIQMKATPVFNNVGFVGAANGAIQQTGASRWQSGHTEIEIEISALVYGDAYTEPLQAIHGVELPENGWPKCFTIAFRIIKDVALRLRIDHGGERQWIPAPRDIGDLQWTLESAGMNTFENKFRSPPSVLMKCFTPRTEQLTIELEELEELKWFEQCRYLSIMYLEMGQNDEALFWLNVGIEALFEEKFGEIAKTAEAPTLAQDLTSPKAFWSEAEEIVAIQFPEMSGKIQWPSEQVHVSIFQKLKFLYKSVSMKTSEKELLKRYRNINKHRNDLFHGRRSKVTTDMLSSAIESFDWIVLNFALN